MKKNKQSKLAVMREALLKQTELVAGIVNAIAALVSEDIPITIAAVASRSGVSAGQVKLIWPEFTELKKERMEMRCTTVEKMLWAHKAMQADLSVSELVAKSLSKIAIHVQAVDQLRPELNKLVSIRTGINSNINQIAKWANTYKDTAEAIDVLCQLQSVQAMVTAQGEQIDEVLGSLLKLVSTAARRQPPEHQVGQENRVASNEDKHGKPITVAPVKQSRPGVLLSHIEEDDDLLEYDPSIWDAELSEGSYDFDESAFVIDEKEQ